jgi:GntR family transcriptional regulator
MIERSVPLVDQVKNYLVDRIADDGFAETGGRLPSEYQLSSALNVSRSTIREALAELARQGTVIRRHGIGTFVNRNARQLTSSISEVVEFHEMIVNQGYQASVKLVRVEVEAATKYSEALALNPKDEVLVIDKIFLADGMPVIFCRNAIPLKLIPERYRQNASVDPAWGEPVYKVLLERCHEDVTHHVARIRAATADEHLAKNLVCSQGHPLLCIAEVGYNLDQEPVLDCLEYYRDDLIHFHAVRGLVRPFSWEFLGSKSES